VRTTPSTFKSLEEGARDLVKVLPQLAETANGLLAELRKQVAEAELPELAHSLRGLADSVRAITQRVEASGVVDAAASALVQSRGLFEDLRGEQGPLLSVSRDLRTVLQRAETVLGEVHAAESSKSLHSAAEGITDAAAEMSAMAREVRAEMVNLRRALHAIEQLALSLERDPSALLRGRSAVPSPLEDKK
jgi:hypothetical protein